MPKDDDTTKTSRADPSARPLRRLLGAMRLFAAGRRKQSRRLAAEEMIRVGQRLREAGDALEKVGVACVPPMSPVVSRPMKVSTWTGMGASADVSPEPPTNG